MLKQKFKPLAISFLGIAFLLTFFDFKISRIFFASAATESISVIRQDCTGYSNCYTSLASWEAAQQRDLVASNEIAVARIEGTWANPDTAAVTIDGWTTGPNNYIKIYTAPEARHGGKWDDTKYRISTNVWNSIALDNKQNYSRIEGLQILHSGGGGSSAGIRSLIFSGVVVKDCIVRKSSSVVGTGIQVVGTSAASTFVTNSVAYGGWNIGIDTSINTSNSYAYNTTSYGNNYGYSGFYTQNLKNCIGANNTIADFARTGSYPVNIANCASSDNSINTFTATNSRVGQTFSFINPVNGDFHISSSDTGAKDFGADLSADPNLAFTTDIDGETRSGSWDIGADEYAASQGGGTPAPSDTTPPTRSGGSPSGALAAGTTQATLTLTTNENATCKYGTTANTAYSSIANIFTTTGGTAHSALATIQNGQSYTYYVRCIDGSGNANTDDYIISFSVSNPDTTTPTIPTNLAAAAISSSQINLSWTASTDAIGVLGYRVFRNGVQIATTTATSYSNTGLTTATAYSYTISAFDAAGNESGQTAPASTTTQNQTTTTTTGGPVLHFSDIISGPKTGNTDGLGSGAIVSIWGNNLGDLQGSSQVYIGGIPASHIYYWGKADGNPNAGPADLYTYHKMQTISFAVPATAPDGLTNISVIVNGIQSNTLPFTVRSGNIYFIKTTGNDSSGTGTWNNPWKTMTYALGHYSGKQNLFPGDILYVGDGVSEIGQVVGANSPGTQIAPISMTSYPGARVTISGTTGYAIGGYNHAGQYWNFSKLVFRTNGDGIRTFRGMRAVANEITNTPGYCATGQGGAITGDDYGNTNPAHEEIGGGIKVLGNYIHDFGCGTTDKLHHIFYISNRGGLIQESYELGWNFLRDNKAYHALHVYDEGVCGDFTGNLKVHDNVVKNQVGVGFDVSTGSLTANPCFSMPVDVYNNLFINVGLENPGDTTHSYAIGMAGGFNKAKVKLYNNTFYGYGDPTASSPAFFTNMANGSGTFSGYWEFVNNIIVSTNGIPYHRASNAFVVPDIHSNNLWFDVNGILTTPVWDTNSLSVNPLFTNINTDDFRLQSTSPAINAGSSLVSGIVTKDFNGVSRPQGSGYDIGAYEYYEGSTVTVPADTAASSSTPTTQPSTPSDTTAPTISSVQAATTTTSATITWTTNENASSQVEYGLTTSYGQSTAVNSTLTTSHSRSITGLSPNTTYNYRVVSRDAAGNTAIGQNRQFTTAAAPDTTAPAAISNLSISNISQSSLALAWVAPTDNSGASSYDLRYSTSPITGANFSSATAFTDVPAPRAAGFVEQYIAVGLTPGTTYYFAIKSTDSSGNVSALSNVVNATTASAPSTTSPTPSTNPGTISVSTPVYNGGGGSGSSATSNYTVYSVTDSTAPGAPTNAKINATNGQISLSWTNPTDSDFVRVKILRKTDAYSTSATDGIIVYGGKDTSFVDTGLTNGATYYYTIYAYDAVPNYSAAVKLSATPKADTTQTSIIAEKNLTNTDTTSTALPHPAGTLLRDSVTKRTYYVDNGGVKRLIVSPSAFSANGFSWKNVVDVSGSVLGRYADGASVSGKITVATSTPANITPVANPGQSVVVKVLGIPAAMKKAALMKVKNTIYAIVNGQRYAIASPSVFNAYKFAWGKVKTVAASQLNRYPRVKLVKAIGSPAVYYLTDRGQKKVIPSADIFLAYGNKWNEIVEILPEDLAKYGDVKLVRLEGDTKIYLLENNTKRHIRSMDVFTRMKLRIDDVVNIKKIEFDAYQTGEDVR